MRHIWTISERWKLIFLVQVVSMFQNHSVKTNEFHRHSALQKHLMEHQPQVDHHIQLLLELLQPPGENYNSRTSLYVIRGQTVIPISVFHHDIQPDQQYLRSTQHRNIQLPQNILQFRNTRDGPVSVLDGKRPLIHTCLTKVWCRKIKIPCKHTC